MKSAGREMCENIMLFIKKINGELHNDLQLFVAASGKCVILFKNRFIITLKELYILSIYGFNHKWEMKRF